MSSTMISITFGVVGGAENVTPRPSVRLKSEPPPTGSRYQPWKYQVEPFVIVPAAAGGMEKSTLFVSVFPKACVGDRR